jgi:hypothetical protein
VNEYLFEPALDDVTNAIRRRKTSTLRTKVFPVKEWRSTRPAFAGAFVLPRRRRFDKVNAHSRLIATSSTRPSDDGKVCRLQTC